MGSKRHVRYRSGLSNRLVCYSRNVANFASCFVQGAFRQVRIRRPSTDLIVGIRRNPERVGRHSSRRFAPA